MADPITPFPFSAASSLARRYGPWAVVTGASDGIGRAFTEALAAQGFNIVLVARRESRLQDLAAELQERFAAKTRVVVADLAQRSAITEIDHATRDLEVGLLVAAAGFGTSGPLLASEAEIEMAMVDVNCTALLGLTHVFARRLAAQRRGGVLLMSSLLAFQGVPRAANYAATKAYVQTLSEGLRRELAPLGVDVLSCAPGPIRSGFEARANLRMSMGEPPGVVARDALAALGRRTTVRPGWLGKLLELALATLPRRGRTLVMQQVMAGMTAHHPAVAPLPASPAER